MRRSLPTVELVIGALLVAFVAGALALGGGGAARPARAARVSAAHIALIERRVEALRGLRFLHPVPVAIVSPAQARRDGLAESARGESPARRHAEEELLKLLGLLPPGADLRQIASAIYGEQVAGYYDPRTKRLALVRGTGVDDVTLAHELTHALEDQHFGLGRLGDERGDDASSAGQALAEGTATLVELRYAARYPGAISLGQALDAFAQSSGGTPLPPYVMRSLLFPYLSGERFVAALWNTTGDWRLVNLALRYRPPVSTAEVLDPARWLHVVRPASVHVPAAGAPGTGWRRVAESTFGEDDLTELLRTGGGSRAASALAAAWRGGRYELWRRGPLPDPACAAPCRRRDALVLAWRVGSPAARRALVATLGLWLRIVQRAHAVGTSAYALPGGSTAELATSGVGVRFALAPSRGLAALLVR